MSSVHFEQLAIELGT